MIEIKAGEGIRYTVPQKVHKDSTGKAVDVFFRVTRIYGKAQIEVRNKNEVLAVFGRQRMAPGEMESIKLPPSVLVKADGEVNVSIREA